MVQNEKAQGRAEQIVGSEDEKDINYIITERGSKYTFLEDGRTQRFKEATGKLNEPQDILVFIPTYSDLRRLSPQDFDFETILGRDEGAFLDLIVGYIHGHGKSTAIIDGNGRRLDSYQALQDRTFQYTDGPVFLAFIRKIEERVLTDFSIPVARKPKLGYSTYDTRGYVDSTTGEYKREKHTGHKVIEIVYK